MAIKHLAVESIVYSHPTFTLIPSHPCQPIEYVFRNKKEAAV